MENEIIPSPSVNTSVASKKVTPKTGAILKARLSSNTKKKKVKTSKETPKELKKFRKMADDLKAGIDRPSFNLFPSRNKILKRQGRMPQLDGLEEGTEEIVEEKIENKEGATENKEEVLVSKRKFIYFPSKNDPPLVYRGGSLQSAEANTAELVETRVRADENKEKEDREGEVNTAVSAVAASKEEDDSKDDDEKEEEAIHTVDQHEIKCSDPNFDYEK